MGKGPPPDRVAEKAKLRGIRQEMVAGQISGNFLESLQQKQVLVEISEWYVFGKQTVLVDFGQVERLISHTHFNACSTLLGAPPLSHYIRN